MLQFGMDGGDMKEEAKKNWIERAWTAGAAVMGWEVANLTWPVIVDFFRSVVYDMVCK